MIEPYRTLIDAESLAILPKTGNKREQVVNFCISLATHPHDESDGSVYAPSNRHRYQLSRIEGYVVFWWTDHPVKRVIAVNIEKE